MIKKPGDNETKSACVGTNVDTLSVQAADVCRSPDIYISIA